MARRRRKQADVDQLPLGFGADPRVAAGDMMDLRKIRELAGAQKADAVKALRAFADREFPYPETPSGSISLPPRISLQYGSREGWRYRLQTRGGAVRYFRRPADARAWMKGLEDSKTSRKKKPTPPAPAKKRPNRQASSSTSTRSSRTPAKKKRACPSGKRVEVSAYKRRMGQLPPRDSAGKWRKKRGS